MNSQITNFYKSTLNIIKGTITRHNFNLFSIIIWEH